jgi:hypothetical protein
VEEQSSSPYNEERLLHHILLNHKVEGRYSQTSEETPTKDEENPPNARHWYERVLRNPKRTLETRPSETRIQMVRLQVFNHTPLEDCGKM